MRRGGAIGNRAVYDDDVWRLSAFAAWAGMLSISFFFYTEDDPFLPEVRQQDVFYLQIAALAVFFCLAYAAARYRGFLSAFTRLGRLNAQNLITWSFVYFVISSLFAEAPLTALGYAVLTWMTFAMSAASWPQGSAAIKSSFTLTTCVLLLVLIGLLVQFGYHGNRIMGGNQPNAVGQLAFIAVVCALLSHLPLRALGVVVGALFIYFVNSRSSALALIVFFLLFLLTPPYGRLLPHFLLRSLILLWLSAAIPVLVLLLQSSPLLQFIVEWLRLYDPGSGLGSGMTGRTKLWALALAEISKEPFFGNGFRVEFSSGGHSGYLSLIGETGIIGALLLLTAITWLLFAHLRNAGNRAQTLYDRHLSKVIVSFLGANLLVLWVVEPMYISLGFPTQALLIYFLAKPIAHTSPSDCHLSESWKLTGGKDSRSLPASTLQHRG